ncbi:MAG: NAD(P)H-dependent glycerol-3-phosphate dehydrogenase, partial [Chloroflexota bacterium]
HGVFADVVDAIDADTICVNLAKGMDTERDETAFTILKNTLPQCQHWVLSGPSIANEFVQGHPTQVMLAGGDKTSYQHIAKKLSSSTFRTQFSDDVVGTEWGGIIKNIYAIGLGLLPVPRAVNTQALYLNRALDEMATLFELLGTQRASAYALPAMGDFLATALSPHSHNRGLGETVRDNPDYLQKAIADDHLPEGYYTLQYMLTFASERAVKLPIAESIQAVLHGQRPSQHMLDMLPS